MRREINLALAASGAGGKRIVELVAGTKQEQQVAIVSFFCLASVVA